MATVGRVAGVLVGLAEGAAVGAAAGAAIAAMGVMASDPFPTGDTS